MAKIKTVGTIREFTSGEYKVKEAKQRKARVQKLEKVATVGASVALPLAFGAPLGAVAMAIGKTMTQQYTLSNPLTLTASAGAVPTMAQVPNAGEWLGEKSMSALAHALDPLLDVLVALSFPICSVVIVGSCFWFMFGKSDLAWKNIQNAGLGYCIIQLSPFILDLLKNIGNAL
jgi:hypothetical protein